MLSTSMLIIFQNLIIATEVQHVELSFLFDAPENSEFTFVVSQIHVVVWLFVQNSVSINYNSTDTNFIVVTSLGVTRITV